MNDFIKNEEIVEYVLRIHEESRKDDFYLIYKVYELINANLRNKSFEEVMLNHKLYGLPSFHTITRCRRKLFEKYPNLKPVKITEKRKDLEEEYKEYSRNV